MKAGFMRLFADASGTTTSVADQRRDVVTVWKVASRDQVECYRLVGPGDRRIRTCDRRNRVATCNYRQLR
jgi:hypothetical protein